MAKHNNGLLRGLRGRIGNTIFYKHGNQDCIRAAPLEYHDANTPEQQRNRTRLTIALRFYQQLAETPLKPIWKIEGHRLKTNGFALFMKTNISMFTHEGKISDFSRLQLGIGKQQHVNNMTASVDEQDNVTLQCDDNSGCPSALATDRLMVVVLFSNRSFTPVILDNVQALREDGYASFHLERKKRINAHIYCFFASQDGKHFSNDKYFKL